MKCPVCAAEYRDGRCPTCGFDPAQDYESYPSLAPLAGGKPLSALRAEWQERNRDLLRCSGCGGLGCARFSGTLALDKQDETKCETIGRMAHVFPTWMNEKYVSFGTKADPFPIGEEVNRFPLDAHMLRAACAPRAVFNSEGTHDFWANSFGTQLCRDAAQKVYEFLGVPDRNVFHIRPGGHDFNWSDWAALIDFCDIVLHRERTMPLSGAMTGPYVINLKDYAPWA